MSTEAKRQFCTFVVEGLVFGIQVEHVQEVLMHQEMTPVPLAPRTVRGLLNLRGQIVTAIEMRTRLGLRDRPADSLPTIVVVRVGEDIVSLLVDEIGDVVDIGADGVEPPPRPFAAPRARCFRESARCKEAWCSFSTFERPSTSRWRRTQYRSNDLAVGLEAWMRALVVDDSRVMRSILRRTLLKEGLDVVEAGDGDEALARLDEPGRFDLMLVDWNMPGVNGLELVRRVRADPRHAATPMMMVTSEVEAEPIREALDAGANDYLMKPFTEDDLRGKLLWLGVTVRDT